MFRAETKKTSSNKKKEQKMSVSRVEGLIAALDAADESDAQVLQDNILPAAQCELNLLADIICELVGDSDFETAKLFRADHERLVQSFVRASWRLSIRARIAARRKVEMMSGWTVAAGKKREVRYETGEEG